MRLNLHEKYEGSLKVRCGQAKGREEDRACYIRNESRKTDQGVLSKQTTKRGWLAGRRKTLCEYMI